ncbi:hybrid sensor histidine kinase/response regulator [Aquitalea sp.]|uniref:ATP-binding response regulator n=1 Tax=Aquitalea sp. TaxID=1872623 RepID=UPI00258D356E|nr:hybrid sensor histidine kinase/response regulator [Aquitalea sp.]
MLWPRFDPPRLLAAQMELIDHSFGIAMLGCFVASLLMAMGVYVSTGNVDTMGWSALMGVGCAAGHFGRFRIRDRLTEARAPYYARCMTLLLVFLGSMWGIAGGLYMDLNFPPTAISLLSMIAGMSAAALAIFSPCLPVAVGFFIPSILPVWGVFLATGNLAYLPMFLGVPLFLLVLLIFALNYARVARRSIELRFENTELVDQLREQTGRAAEALHEAEEANRAKLVFLASASHDLRQPMHALGLFLATLKTTTLNPRQQELLEHIEASASAACEMLDTLLDFSKLEAGVIEARPRQVALQSILYKLECEFAPLANGKNLVFRVRESAVHVHTDPSLLELILRNLISNAINYTQSGGILIGCRQRGEHLLIEVWDSGIGIPPAQQQEVFREFHQLGNPERDRRKGLGLGLAIVRGLALTMGLKVELQSRPGRGSVFRLHMPLASSQPELAETVGSTPRQLPLQAVPVLVIDDDYAVRSAMEALLGCWGCHILTVEGGAEALDCLDSFQPRVVIADYRLRGNQTGQQVLKQICQQLGRNIPSIIMTGDTAPNRLREAQSSGAVLLHKPVDAAALYGSIQALLAAG